MANETPNQHAAPAAKPYSSKDRAAIAFKAIGTLIIDGGLPPEAMSHLKAASEALLAAAMQPDATPQSDPNAPRMHETLATQKARENGEAPKKTDDEPTGDDTPPDKKKGEKPNPLASVKLWASSPTKDDEPKEKPKKATPKPAGSFANGRARFFGRR